MLKKAITICLLLAAICLCACQPTPEEPFVVSKGDGSLQSILAGSYPAQLSEPYQAPDTWTETIEGLSVYDNNLVIEVEAEIAVPQALSYPVYRAEDAQLSQEEADSFIHYFIGDEKLYEYEPFRETDEYYRVTMEMAEYQLNNPNSRLNTDVIEEYGEPENNELYEGMTEYCESWIEICLKALTEPKNAIEMEPLFEIAEESTFGIDLCTYELDKYIGLSPGVGGRRVYYMTNNLDCMGIVGTYATKENLIDLTISQEEAKEMASPVVSGLGYDDWNLVHTGAVGMFSRFFHHWLEDEIDERSIYEHPQGYWLTYTPPIFEDIPLLYYSNNDLDFNQADVELVVSNSYAPRYAYHPSLHLGVFDDGVRYAILNSAMNVTDTVNENVPLLPFEEIQDIFRRYILMETDFSYYTGEHDETLDKTIIRIKDIALGYMKVGERNSSDSLLMPVWMFYGTQHDRYPDQEHTGWRLDENNERTMETAAGLSFIIINAIDGSIIDPMLGY